MCRIKQGVLFAFTTQTLPIHATQTRIPNLLPQAILPPPCDLRKERLAVRLTSEEVLHQLRGMSLPALRKDRVAVALADLGIEEVAAEGREHVER